jgi:WD40 repeat protein
MLHSRSLVAGLIVANLLAVAVGLSLWWPARAHRESASNAVLEGHRYWVRAVAFSPDGKTLAAVGGVLGKGGEVKLWDLEQGRERATLDAQADTIEAVAFSPDGRLLATATYDNTVRLWDLSTLRPGQTLRGRGERVFSLAFGADNRTLTAASFKGMVRVWDVIGGAERAALPAARGPKMLSADGRTLAIGSRTDGKLVLVHVASGRKRVSEMRHASDPFCLAFSPDGKTLASGDFQGTVYLWDAATLELRAKWGGHHSPVVSLAFSPDGRTLASGSTGRTVKLWVVASGQVKTTLRGHEGAITSVAFAPDGKWLASGSYDKTVRLWGMTAVQ